MNHVIHESDRIIYTNNPVATFAELCMSDCLSTRTVTVKDGKITESTPSKINWWINISKIFIFILCPIIPLIAHIIKHETRYNKVADNLDITAATRILNDLLNYDYTYPIIRLTNSFDKIFMNKLSFDACIEFLSEKIENFNTLIATWKPHLIDDPKDKKDAEVNRSKHALSNIETLELQKEKATEFISYCKGEINRLKVVESLASLKSKTATPESLIPAYNDVQTYGKKRQKQKAEQFFSAAIIRNATPKEIVEQYLMPTATILVEAFPLEEEIIHVHCR